MEPAFGERVFLHIRSCQIFRFKAWICSRHPALELTRRGTTINALSLDPTETGSLPTRAGFRAQLMVPSFLNPCFCIFYLFYPFIFMGFLIPPSFEILSNNYLSKDHVLSVNHKMLFRCNARLASCPGSLHLMHLKGRGIKMGALDLFISFIIPPSSLFQILSNIFSNSTLCQSATRCFFTCNARLASCPGSLHLMHHNRRDIKMNGDLQLRSQTPIVWRLAPCTHMPWRFENQLTLRLYIFQHSVNKL